MKNFRTIAIILLCSASMTAAIYGFKYYQNQQNALIALEADSELVAAETKELNVTLADWNKRFGFTENWHKVDHFAPLPKAKLVKHDGNVWKYDDGTIVMADKAGIWVEQMNSDEFECIYCGTMDQPITVCHGARECARCGNSAISHQDVALLNEYAVSPLGSLKLVMEVEHLRDRLDALEKRLNG